MKLRSIFISSIFVFCISTLSTSAQTTVNDDVKSLIKKKRAHNKNNGFGFRIQLDNGLERAIKTTKSKFGLEFPAMKTYILFESPDWKVQVGDYKTRLEADKILNNIKLKFPGAIVVPR
jgi:hypothetical protein